MSNVNNQFKELVNEAIHNHFHDKTELEMTLKDWLYGMCEQVDEYEANLNEVKTQLKIKIRHARRDGDYSEAYAFSEALDMIGDLI